MTRDFIHGLMATMLATALAACGGQKEGEYEGLLTGGLATDVPPVLFYSNDCNHSQVVFWTGKDAPDGDNAIFMEGWKVQDAVCKNAIRYTKVSGPDNTWVDVQYKEEVVSTEERPADLGSLRNRWHPMMGLKYDIMAPNKDSDKMKEFFTHNLGWLFADDYLKDREQLAVKPLGYSEETKKGLPSDIVSKMEQQFGMTADRAETTALIGDKYTAGFIQFKPKGEIVVAVELLAWSTDSLVCYADTATINPSDTELYSVWHVDDGGEYFGNSIDYAFMGPNGLEMLYTHMAPESTDFGFLTIDGDRLIRHEVGGYYNYMEGPDDRDLPRTDYTFQTHFHKDDNDQVDAVITDVFIDNGKEKVDSLESLLFWPKDADMMSGAGEVEEKDINFDGIPDLLIFLGSFNVFGPNDSYDAWVWHDGARMFIHLDDFSGYFNPEFNKEEKCIVSRSNTAAGTVQCTKFTWDGYQLKKMEEWSEEGVDD